MIDPVALASLGVEGRYDTMPLHAAARMSFANLVGHRHVITLLARALAHETLPPSLIFAGPPGVGKFTTAVALGQGVNCLDPIRPGPGLFDASVEGGLAFDACGTCRSCVRIARAVDRIAQGAEPAIDCLRVLAPDDRRSIKIDRVRDVLAATAFRPFDGRRRVVVIDERRRTASIHHAAPRLRLAGWSPQLCQYPRLVEKIRGLEPPASALTAFFDAAAAPM